MRSIWRTVGPASLRAILVISASVLVIGISYGVTAVQSGLTWWQALSISLLVTAGSSEFVFLGVVAAGGLPIVAALAGLLVNARNFGYGLAVGEHLPRGPKMWLGAHFINDETAAITAGETDPARTRMLFYLCGLGVFISWPLGTLIGIGINELTTDPDALGLDAAFPALLAALALPALRERVSATAAGIGAAVALATTPLLPAGLPVIAALVGVAAVQWIRPRRHDDENVGPSSTPASREEARS